MNATTAKYFGSQEPSSTVARPALLVVDLTNSCAHPDHGWVRLHRRRGAAALVHYYITRLQTQVLPNTRFLIDRFRERAWPVVYAVYGARRADLADLPARAQLQHEAWSQQGLPSPFRQIPNVRREVLQELAPHRDELVVRKVVYGAFRGSSLHRRLAAAGVDTLVFVGVGTNYCVMLSLLEAYDLGYRCVLVRDATATLSDDEQVTAEHFVEPYALVLPAVETVSWLDAAISLPVGREGNGG